MSLFHLLFGFSGRANRGKFWLAVVLWIIFWSIAVPVCVLAAIIILGLHLPDSSLPHDELIVSPNTNIFMPPPFRSQR